MTRLMDKPESEAPATRPAGAFLLWRSHVLTGSILVLLIAAGAIERFSRFNSWPLAPDENWSAYLASGHGDEVLKEPHNKPVPAPRVDFADPHTSWMKVITGLTGVTHPPLYYLALRFWALAVGESDLRLRMFSAVCSLLCIPAMYGVIRQRGSALAALLGAAMMATAWSQIEFAQEARPYALLILISLSCAAAFQSTQSRPNRVNALWLFASVFLLCLTHYFAAGAVLAMAVGAFILRRSARGHAIAAVFGGIILAAALWLPFLIRSIGPCEALYSGYLHSDHPHIFANLLSAPARVLLSFPSPALAHAIAALLIIAMIVGGRSTLFWAMWVIFSLLFIAACDAIHHSELLAEPKYIVIILPALIALLCGLEGAFARPIYLAVMLALLLGITCDGISRAMNQSGSMLVWYHEPPPRLQRNVLIFSEIYPGSQPLEYIAYRRQHPEMREQIMFIDGNEAARR